MQSTHGQSLEIGAGRILADKYRLVRPLGQGAMGSVWQANHLALQATVAIKLLDRAIAGDPQSLNRFMLEARAAAALRSVHVVQVLDHGVDQGTPYIVMEQLEGETLAERLHRVGSLSPAEVARAVIHIARALSRAHAAGIVHRDLKPENVFLVRNDEEEVAKLFDFGIAKSLPGMPLSSLDLTFPGVLVGTPYYMSPEQTAGVEVDPRSDIWALGVIAFECLVGRRPFEEPTLELLLHKIRVDPLPIPSDWTPVPEGFDTWFSRACARDREQRYSSAKQAADALQQVCTSSTANRIAAQGRPPIRVSERFRFMVFGGSRPALALVLALLTLAATLGVFAANRVGYTAKLPLPSSTSGPETKIGESVTRATTAETSPQVGAGGRTEPSRSSSATSADLKTPAVSASAGRWRDLAPSRPAAPHSTRIAEVVPPKRPPAAAAVQPVPDRSATQPSPEREQPRVPRRTPEAAPIDLGI